MVRARALALDDHGFAVPTVLFMLLAAFAVVSVGVVASIQAQHGSIRDQDSKAALAVAETGVSQAMLRYNSNLDPDDDFPCLLPNGSTLGSAATDSAGWCQGVEDPASGYRYWACPRWSDEAGCLASGPPTGKLAIVSVGSSSGVTRRVEVIANSSSGQRVFIDASVKTQDGIALDSNATIRSSSATGGDITLGSNARQCGSASVGVGHHINPSNTTGYYSDTGCTNRINASTVTQNDITLPPVNQGDAATSNDNCRITAAVTNAQACPSQDYRDLVSGNRASVAWSATTRQLTVDSNTALTLTGQTYSFCKVTLRSNSAIYIQSGQTVNIYFDSPEACDVPAGTLPVDASGKTTQMDLSSNSRITSAGGDPASVAIYFVGSETRPTRALMSSNTQVNTSQACVQNFVIYAPATHLEMNSNSSYCGALAGKSLHLNSNANIATGSESQNFVLPGTSPHYVTSRFVECGSVEASPPDSGC
jgi:hypothetical protein